MADHLSREAIEIAANSMIIAAQLEGIHAGVAVVLLIKLGGSQVSAVATNHQMLKPNSTDPTLPLRNCFGLVWGKIARSLVTGENSGAVNTGIPLSTGEFDAPGCLRRPLGNGDILYVAYSGGTSQQDIDIAQEALDSLTEGI